MKVWPTSDAMRKILMHPGVRVPFPASGPLDWPDDAFTTRRLADGDVTTVDQSPPANTPTATAPTVIAEPVATHDYGTDHTKPPITKPPAPKKSKGE